MMRRFCQLYLTCADEGEAAAIARALLEKRLIACAKLVPVQSTFRWQGKIEQSKEVMLVMDSAEDLFESIEAEVARRHRYETFVLQMVSVARSSSDAEKWLSAELKESE